MVPSPATIPVTIPSTEGLPWRTHSMPIHAREPAAAEMWVTSMAMPASPFAASAEPPLKPNQPTHNIPAPVTVMVRLWGGMACSGKPLRLPITSAATSAATPAVICTTVPPAKSSRPICPSQPPPHTQWVMGTYTTSSHRMLNTSMVEKRMRSAKAPTISAGVIMAKVIWNITKTDSGMVPDTESSVSPARNIWDQPPKNALPSVNARL